jgi:uncharacterized membrane-anchored protein
MGLEMRKLWMGLLVLLLASGSAQAQMSEQEMRRQFAELHWLTPASKGVIAGKAEFKASEKFTFLGAQDTDKFLKLNGNPPWGGMAYTIAPVQGSWFGILSFAEEGYVKDTETIDADALLEQLKTMNVQSNEEKRKQGYPTLTLTGWALPPRYDQANRRLEWGTRLVADDTSQELVNVSTKLLGRRGHTSATLVTSPATMEADLAEFKVALKDFDYVSGEKYSEWREGDKVAAYGLGALVLGGAAAVATSKGGLKVLWMGLLAGAAAVWGGIKRVLARKKA